MIASGEGNGNPLQHSCLENPRDRGGWLDTVHGVAESDTTERRTRQLQEGKVESAPGTQSIHLIIFVFPSSLLSLLLLGSSWK